MTKGLDIMIGVVLILAVGSLVYWEKADDAAAIPLSASQNAGSISAESIAHHATRESCWSSINGGVYDLTAWIPKHPGGEEAILQLCGTDGSAEFNGAHGGAARQAAVLAGFKIGELAR